MAQKEWNKKPYKERTVRIGIFKRDIDYTKQELYIEEYIRKENDKKEDVKLNSPSNEVLYLLTYFLSMTSYKGKIVYSSELTIEEERMILSFAYLNQGNEDYIEYIHTNLRSLADLARIDVSQVRDTIESIRSKPYSIYENGSRTYVNWIAATRHSRVNDNISIRFASDTIPIFNELFYLMQLDV